MSQEITWFRNKYGLEEIVKDIGVKMSKRKSTNSALLFDDVLNDINDWLAEETGENDEIGDNSNPSEECLEEEQQSEEPEDNVNRQQR